MLLRHFVMTSFFKINVIIGQFLNNTSIYYERRQELNKPISLKKRYIVYKNAYTKKCT